MNPEPSARLFIAIHPPEALIDEIRRFERRHRNRFPGRSVRWTPPEQLHVTLRFFGEVPLTAIDPLRQRFREVCASRAAHSVTTGRMGCFPSLSRPRVLWLGLEGEGVAALLQLQHALEAETRDWGRPPDHEFHPHLTLARVRPPAPRELKDWLRDPPEFPHHSWAVNAVRLMRSQLEPEGAVHTLLEAAPLATLEGGGDFTRIAHQPR